MATFTSQINGNDIFAKRAEATRSGVNLETFTPTGGTEQKGILPAGLVHGAEGTNDSNILATQQYVKDQVGSVAEAMLYKGVVDGTHALPANGYKAGWTYKVAADGTYAGKVCEMGDLIIANKPYAAGTASNDDWDVIQTNIDGAVVGPASAVNLNIAAFDGTTGKLIKDAGVAIETTLSASSDAKVPTSKAVKDAITGAVNALDITAISNTAGKTVATITEQDGVVGATFQDIQITESQVTNLTNDLAAKAPLESPALTGTPTAPTAAAGTDSTQIATTAFVQAAVAGSSDFYATYNVTTVAEIKAAVAAGKSVYLKVAETIGEDYKTDRYIPLSRIVEKDGETTVYFEEVRSTSTNSGLLSLTGTVYTVVSSGEGADTWRSRNVTPAKIIQNAVSDPSASGTTLTAIDTIEQDENGEISVTKKTIQDGTTSQKGVVQLAGSIGATVAEENNKAATEKAVRDAINALDVTAVTVGASKTLASISEADGKISASAVDIAITGAQVTVASATSGNFAGLDASGHVVDSGSKAADFKTKQTAVTDPSASGNASAFIATISQDANGVITATKANLPTAAPTDQSGTHPGMVTYETVEL